MASSDLDPRPGLVRRLRLASHLLADASYDALRYWRHSFTAGARVQENLRARIAIGLHFLEYGMSLRDAQPGHALDRAMRLAADLDTYTRRFGPDATVQIALDALEAYLGFNAASGHDLPALRARVDALVGGADEGLRGGVEMVTASEIREKGRIDFLSFAEARHSIRQYSPEPVPREAIERAVRVAQQSPSSCNRQTCRAWIWTEREAVQKVLALQNGNRGFGDQLGGVAVVTSDIAHWETAAERYQGWVDGGMFAMSLAYGLHAEGLGAVMLNWSVSQARDRALRRLTGIGDSSLIITMIGFGCLPDELRVPVSQRKPLGYALALNQPLAG
ncbi:nitroreductase family protein [Rubellimicrobium arenae]|uniref:nitroreductase family protein n=1 Tax=Rubellimicrobium arenae TaxID=2817372 RepID=UPI001B30BC2C|nr:nitroreductase family protein [Rubellimicrobium arenae]